DLYTTKIRDAVATNRVGDMRAAISYMIEPTDAKANAIRGALFSAMNQYAKGLLDWYSSDGCHECGYELAFMFDLIQAYHPNIISAAERTSLKSWFKRSAESCCKYVGWHSANRSGPLYDGEGGKLFTEAGKTEQSMANWWSRFMGPSFAAALVSGDQAD